MATRRIWDTSARAEDTCSVPQTHVTWVQLCQTAQRVSRDDVEATGVAERQGDLTVQSPKQFVVLTAVSVHTQDGDRGLGRLLGEGDPQPQRHRSDPEKDCGDAGDEADGDG